MLGWPLRRTRDVLQGVGDQQALRGLAGHVDQLQDNVLTSVGQAPQGVHEDVPLARLLLCPLQLPQPAPQDGPEHAAQAI